MGRRDRHVGVRAGGCARSAELLRDPAATSSSPCVRAWRLRAGRPSLDGRAGLDAEDELAADYSNYGPLKALAEAEVERVFGDRLIVRPGLIVGPHDPTGRFTYWAHRLARGGELLAPAPPERASQFIDVRDLAAWILDAAERGLTGTYNATNEGVSWSELLAGAEVTWVADEFLQEHEVGPWLELPPGSRIPSGSGCTRSTWGARSQPGSASARSRRTIRGAVQAAAGRRRADAGARWRPPRRVARAADSLSPNRPCG